jgi:type I restriction enzyme M protein
MQQDGSNGSLGDQPVIAALAADLLHQREDAATEFAVLDAAIKAAESGDEDAESEEAEPEEESLTEAELKELKSRRTKAKKQLKDLDNRLLQSASWAREGLGPEQVQTLVLSLLRQRLAVALDRRVAAHGRELANWYMIWHDKYAVTLRELEAERDDASKRLDEHLTGLGYD